MNDELAALEVRVSVANGLHQPDQLALISSELEVSRREGMAKEGNGALPLVKHRPKP